MVNQLFTKKKCVLRLFTDIAENDKSKLLISEIDSMVVAFTSKRSLFVTVVTVLSVFNIFIPKQIQGLRLINFMGLSVIIDSLRVLVRLEESGGNYDF